MKLDRKQIIVIILGALTTGLVSYLLWRYERKQSRADASQDQANSEANAQAAQNQFDQVQTLLSSVGTSGVYDQGQSTYPTTSVAGGETDSNAVSYHDSVADEIAALFPAAPATTPVDSPGGSPSNGPGESSATLTTSDPGAVTSAASGESLVRLKVGTGTIGGDHGPNSNLSSPISPAGSGTITGIEGAGNGVTQVGNNLRQPLEAAY